MSAFSKTQGHVSTSFHVKLSDPAATKLLEIIATHSGQTFDVAIGLPGGDTLEAELTAAELEQLCSGEGLEMTLRGEDEEQP